MREEVAFLIGEVRRAESFLQDAYGFCAKDCKILEVGVGQLPRQIAYFARDNEVIGIDLDVVPSGFALGQYFNLFRRNGPKRLLKTVARKILGMDRRFDRELCHLLGIKKVPPSTLMQMDAMAMQFPSNSFDFVYSFNVFEHLPDPISVLTEIKRVLKPNGCAAIHFHLYTSDSGCHDVRILSGDREGVAYWPHLRPAYHSQVKSAAYINKLRVSEWEELFAKELPGCQLDCWADPRLEELAPKLALLREDGELVEFTDRELLTLNCVFYWKKPL